MHKPAPQAAIFVNSGDASPYDFVRISRTLVFVTLIGGQIVIVVMECRRVPHVRKHTSFSEATRWTGRSP